MSLAQLGVIFLSFVALSQALSAGLNNGTGGTAEPIVGGHLADIKNYPHQLYMLADGIPCGAAIISEQWALTAAHCCGGEGTDSRFRLYNVTLRSGSSFSSYGGEVHTVVQVTPHEKYNQTTLDNDICLLKVEKPFDFNEKTRSIDLPTSKNAYKSGANAFASGWGSIKFGDEYPTEDRLLAVKIPIISNMECQRLFRKDDTPYDITARTFCAYKRGRDTCQGDSGGALVVNNQFLGVVSWGNGCGTTPGVYTKVLTYKSWIKQISGI